MLDEAMAAAVETAQKRLMSTTDRGSVLMSVSADLSELGDLVTKLDPSNIDFDKGGLERIKAVNYWNKFEESYPALKALLERLDRSKKILFNSIKTVKRFYDEYMKEYERFRSIPAELRDAGFIQQAAVSENMSSLLKNTVTEHETMYAYLTDLLNILQASLEMSIYFAKRKFNRSIDDNGLIGRLLLPDVTNVTFQSQYRRLHDTVLH